MSISNIDSVVSSLTQIMQMQQKTQEPPLKDKVDQMSEEDRKTFDSKIESFSQEQMMSFMSLMQQNKSEISDMSQEDATTAIFELMDQAETSSLSEVDGVNQTSKVAEDGTTPPPSGGMPPPPPSSGNLQDPFASLSEDEMDTISETLETMTNAQKQEFGFSLMEAKDELASLDDAQASELILSLLEEASTSTTTDSTQNALSNFTRGGSFLDIYS